MRPLLFAAIALLAACKRHPAGEASCHQVGARFYELAHAKLDEATIAAGERDRVAGLLAPMRDSMTKACTNDTWSAAARGCFAGARDQVAFYACDRELTPDQRATLAAGAGK